MSAGFAIAVLWKQITKSGLSWAGGVKLCSWKGASLCKSLEFSVRKTGLCDPVCLLVFIGSIWSLVCLLSILGCNLILGYSFCCSHGPHLWGWLLCSFDVPPPLVFEHLWPDATQCPALVLSLQNSPSSRELWLLLFLPTLQRCIL